MRIFSFFLFNVLISGWSFLAVADELPDVHLYSQLPLVQNLQLSPDGSKAAYLRNHNGETLLISTDIATGKVYSLTKTDNTHFQFRWIRWANNKTLLFGAMFPNRLGGTKVYESRLFSIDYNDPDGTRILVKPNKKNTRSKTLSGGGEYHAQFQDNVIDLLPEEPDYVLVSVAADGPLEYSVYKVNIYSQNMIRVQRTRANVRGWLSDVQGRVRAGYYYDEKDATSGYLIQRLEDEKWIKAWFYKPLEEEGYQVMGFDKDPNLLYLRAYHNDKLAVFIVDLRDEDLQPKLVFADPNYDIDGSLIYSAKTQSPVGVFHSTSEFGQLFWDEGRKALLQGLNAALPDKVNYLVSFSDDERKYILYSAADDQPGTYYFGDRDKGSLVEVFPTYHGLPEASLMPMQAIEYKARDGLKIEAFLTRPNKDEKKATPLIVFPHGGPIARDRGLFDYWTQFFVSRGYAVFQPNYRGSSGYGFDFMQHAVGGYGLAMQDDITDGVRYLIEQGIADPKKICIVGGSYGGYAAMLGLAKTPELYRCAISFAGVSDLLEQKYSYRTFLGRMTAYRQYGHDNKQLQDTSPLNMTDAINAPLLLVHGDRDRVVDVKQSRNMASAMKAAGKKVQYLELEDGNHYLSLQKNRDALFEAMDTFLQQYLSE